MSKLASFLLFFVLVEAQFNIPLPFGNIGLQKNRKGDLEITGNQGFDLFGFGGKRDFKLTTGEGKFEFGKSDSALVNGSEYGGASAFGFDKEKGIDIGQNVTIGETTAVGGPGREGSFLEQLLAAFKPKNRK